MDAQKFWVGIKSPVSVRRTLLLSNKAVLDSLRRYEAFRDLRRQKLELVVGLKHILDELTVLNRRLRSAMPKVPMHQPTAVPHDEELMSEPAHEDHEDQAAPAKKGKAKKEVPRPKTKMDLLAEEIRKIEEKLGTLE